MEKTETSAAEPDWKPLDDSREEPSSSGATPTAPARKKLPVVVIVIGMAGELPVSSPAGTA